MALQKLDNGGYQPPPVLPPVAPPPPPKPAPPPPPSGGYNPYASDPGYQAALANEKLQAGALTQALNNQIQQRLIALGDPGLLSKYGGLDPNTAAYIQQNTLAGNSTMARLGQSHSQNLRAIINHLAASGLLNSGDTGYLSGQEDQSYGHNVYDAQQAALADILGYQQSNLQSQQGLHQGVIDALQQAYQNYLNHPELGGYGAGAPPAGTTGVVGDPNAFGTAAQIAAALKTYNQNLNRNMYG